MSGPNLNRALGIFPVVLDARPAYLQGAGAPASLLLLPLGTGTLLEHVLARLRAVTPNAPEVFATFEIGGRYTAAIREAAPAVRHVVDPGRFASRLETHEPSDWLLIVDPTCFPAEGLDPDSLLRHPLADPRWARHLVALEGSAEGTRECVDLDSAGRVRRIQRFYDNVTWPFTAGVCCSLVPASCTRVVEGLPWTSLAELREGLSAHGIPGRDLPLQGTPLDLTRERDALALGERFVSAAAPGASPVRAGGGHDVHPSARLIGAVVLQAGAVVEAEATVIGPAVIGAGARVGRGALVAHSLVAAGAVVPPAATLRQRVHFGDRPAGAAARTKAADWQAPAPSPEPPASADDRRRSRRIEWKRAFDTALAGLALVLLAPVLLVIAALIKLESRGAVLYGHKREGRNGVAFRCWKFRTMHDGAEAEERALHARSQVDGPQFKLEGDPRITRVGSWLRPFSLDELPQLLNVVRGEMSLVGPRPSPFRENQLCVPWRDGRLSVRPGITGLWQVCRHERSAGDFHQWIRYDLLYVRHLSPLLDLKILLATLLTGGGRSHVPLSSILSSRVLEEDA
jgi:lipopolysaccharide/colanic/teichoic acid biosynthesis glycosyltransferase